MSEPPWAETNRIMLGAGFSQALIRRAQIWAAKDKTCPACEAPPYEACRHLTGIKNVGFSRASKNKFPHTDRIDYDKLKQALIDRGYAR